MNTMHQICCILIVYISGSYLVCVRVCACVYIVWEQILYACIYSRTVAVPANVFVEFNPT